VAAVGNPHRAPHAETALGEVQPVTHGAPHAVKRHPLDELGAHPALQDKILQQPPHVIIGKGGADGGPEAKAAPQPAHDVILAAAFPHFELPRRAHAPFARVQPQHDFTQRDQIVFARTFRFDIQDGHKLLITPDAAAESSRFNTAPPPPAGAGALLRERKAPGEGKKAAARADARPSGSRLSQLPRARR